MLAGRDFARVTGYTEVGDQSDLSLRFADHSLRTRWSVCAGRHFNKPIWVSTEPSHAPLLKHVRPERTSRRGTAMKFTALLFDQGL